MAGEKIQWRTIVATLLVIQSGMPSVLLAAPTAITKTQDLQFGKFAGGSGAAGTVTIGTTGARSSSGSVILLTGTFEPGGFTITGNAGKTYNLTLPASFSVTSGTYQMNVASITSSIPVAGVFPASGTLPFTVGGTLTVTSSQNKGAYSGSLTVTVK